MPKSKPESVPSPAGAPSSAKLAAMALHYDVEQFYFHEAALLDARRFDEWGELLSDDIHYFMPIRRTKGPRELAEEFTAPTEAMSFFNDDKAMLQVRIKRMASGYAWAEDPPSRTRHLVSNLVITAVDGDVISASTCFHVLRTRSDYQRDSWFGLREDKLKRVGESFLICRRTVLIDETVIKSPNLSVMF